MVIDAVSPALGCLGRGCRCPCSGPACGKADDALNIVSDVIANIGASRGRRCRDPQVVYAAIRVRAPFAAFSAGPCWLSHVKRLK